MGSIPTRRTPRWVSCPQCNPAAELDAAAYVYLLGLYLGDGCITAQPRDVWRLRVFQSTKYAGLIAECSIAMQAVLPNRVLVQPKQGCVEIGASSKHWPCLIPQHGPGRKHLRPIVLRAWQQALVDQHPKLLLRGLIHSDGSRHQNRVRRGEREYSYTRYEFQEPVH